MILLFVISALAAAGLVCIEAAVLSGPRPVPYPRWFPALLVGVAVPGLIFSILILRTWLVVSPEFGLVMIEGGASAYVGILALVLLCALSLGLLVSVIRHLLGRPNQAVWSVLGSLVVVALAYVGIHPLNPGDSSALHIVSYDLWWPPFVLWLSACLIEAGHVVGLVENRMRRMCTHAFAVSAVALIAMQRPDFLDPATERLWQYIALMAFGLSVGLAPFSVWWTLCRSAGNTRPTARIVIGTLAWCAVIAVAWVVWPEYRSPAAWILWGMAAIAVTTAIGWQVRRSQPDGTTTTLSIPVGQRFLMAGAVLTLAVSLLDLFYLDIVDPALAIAGFAAGWAILAEATGDGVLGRCFRLLRESPPAPEGHRGSAVFRWGYINLRNALAGMLRLVRRTLAASSIAGVLLKVVAWIVVLVALSEVPNAGTTIIGSFTVESDAKQKDIGQALAEHLMYALHKLHEGLRSDVALVSRGTSKSDSKFRFASANDGPTHLEAALAKHPDVPLGPVNLPVEVLIAPIRDPVRWLLGVRVISGSVHTGPQYFTALAHSSSGDAWKAQIDRSPLDTKDSDIVGALPILAEQLANQITTMDGSSRAAGLTRSPDALASFQLGWSAWRQFEVEADVAALDRAIEYFGKAITRDWGFSLAHYRLGRAMREAQHPGAAIEAFRASVTSNPTFGAGLAALASTLYDYDSYSESQPVATRAVSRAPTDEQRRATLFRKNEAERIWQAMVHAPARRVSSLDRASASAGLCLRASDLHESLEDVNNQIFEMRKRVEMFQPRQAFQAWQAFEAMKKRVDKDSTPGGTTELARLKDAYDKAFEPLTKGKEERNKALTEFAALGATSARATVKALEKTLDDFGNLSPDSESKAEDSTKAVLHDIQDLKQTAENQGKIQSFRTYFYCRRADKIYAALANGDADDGDLRAGAARVAYLLGLTLERRNGSGARALEWSCTTNDGFLRGPYSRAALKYYDHAITLTPDDLNVRCQAALTAQALDDSTRLDALEHDFAARLSLAALRSAWYPAYDNALEEYRAAIERNPNSVEALNGYAYTFWAQRYSLSQKNPRPERSGDTIASDEETANRALNYALRAVALVEGKRPPDFEIMIRSTLGEVLLGRREFERAREELERALKLDSGKNPRYNEVRWDLAQAFRCLARERGDPTGALQSRAAELLKQIRALELGNELRPFSEADLLDGAHSLCLNESDQANPPPAAPSK